MSSSIGEDLDLQRALQFLPYFVLGLCLKPEHFELVRRRAVRALAVPVLVSAFAVAYWSRPYMSPAWFYHRDSAEEIGAPVWAGPVMTLAVFGCSTVLVICFLALVPRRRMWFTALGAGTLYGYLLHGFVVQGVKPFHVYDYVHGPLGVAAVSVVAAMVVTLLCTSGVRRVFRFAVEPRMAWFFEAAARPTTTAPSPQRRVGVE
jgi:fucose 4-O-acetylase-like acetyltransferase